MFNLKNYKPKKKIIGRYQFLEAIGSGQFGKVFKAMNEKHEIFAVKEIPKQTLYLKNKLKDLFYNEVVPHIFSYFGLIDYLESSDNCYLVMEYCEGGDLESLLLIKGHLPQNEAVTHFKEILHGFKVIKLFKTEVYFQCLHAHNIIHRDFKAANVFIKDDVFKIGDFGFAKIMDDPNTTQKTILGTPLYMSPEILSNKPYTNKTDI